MGFKSYPGADGSTPVLGGPGLTLVRAVTFTAAATVSLDSCFTATHANYLVVMDVTSQSASAALALRLRVAGADASSAVYALHGIYGGALGTGGINDNALAQWGLSSPGAGGTSHGLLTLIRPAEASVTRITTLVWDSRGVGSEAGGAHDSATAYTGLTIYPSTGTITGSLQVYGYKRA